MSALVPALDGDLYFAAVRPLPSIADRTLERVGSAHPMHGGCHPLKTSRRGAEQAVAPDKNRRPSLAFNRIPANLEMKSVNVFGLPSSRPSGLPQEMILLRLYYLEQQIDPPYPADKHRACSQKLTCPV